MTYSITTEGSKVIARALKCVDEALNILRAEQRFNENTARPIEPRRYETYITEIGLLETCQRELMQRKPSQAFHSNTMDLDIKLVLQTVGSGAR